MRKASGSYRTYKSLEKLETWHDENAEFAVKDLDVCVCVRACMSAFVRVRVRIRVKLISFKYIFHTSLFIYLFSPLH